MSNTLPRSLPSPVQIVNTTLTEIDQQSIYGITHVKLSSHNYNTQRTNHVTRYNSTQTGTNPIPRDTIPNPRPLSRCKRHATSNGSNSLHQGLYLFGSSTTPSGGGYMQHIPQEGYRHLWRWYASSSRVHQSSLHQPTIRQTIPCLASTYGYTKMTNDTIALNRWSSVCLAEGGQQNQRITNERDNQNYIRLYTSR